MINPETTPPRIPTNPATASWRWWLAFHRKRRADQLIRDEWLRREQLGREAEKLAEQQALEATKPKPPSPKSKRLTASDRSSRQFNRRFGPSIGLVILCSIFLSMAGPDIFFTWTPILAIATFIGTSMWNGQEWVQRSWRDEEDEERANWSKEDAEWNAYELALKAWEEERRRLDEIKQTQPITRPSNVELSEGAKKTALDLDNLLRQ